MVAGAALALASCDEGSFLSIKPQATLSEELLTDESGLELLCTSAYAALAGPEAQSWEAWLAPTTNWSYGEVRSDNAYKGGGGVGDIVELHRIETFDTDPSNGMLDQKWYHLYCSISRANAALRTAKAQTANPVAATRAAEMRVLRAHYYFELSRLFCHVPYFDETATDAQIAAISNRVLSRDSLLGCLAAEMEAAAAHLPERQSETGRVNALTAKAYAAKILLYRAWRQDDKTNAVTGVDTSLLRRVVALCDEVLPHYSLLDDYQKLDLIEYENGPESVFAVQYSIDDGTQDAGRVCWANLLNSPGGDSPYHGDGFFLPSQDIINAYRTDSAGLPLTDNGSATGDYSTVKVLPDGTCQLTDTASNVDPRLDFAVGRPGIRWKTYTEAPAGAWVRDKDTYGYNCIKRFWLSPESKDMYHGWPWGASGLNWQIIRCADLMLWKAEALIEIGGADNIETARTLINALRRRAASSAAVSDWADPSRPAARYRVSEYPAEGFTQERAREALRRETRLEKAFEGERFFDLVRWGIAAPTINTYLDREARLRPYLAVARFTPGRDEYFPVPYNQVSFSHGVYEQNPGY